MSWSSRFFCGLVFVFVVYVSRAQSQSLEEALRQMAPRALAEQAQREGDAARGAIVFVTFAAGDTVYGLQGVSQGDAPLPEQEIIGAARDLYEKVTAAP